MNKQGAANPLDARLSQEEVKDVYNSAAKIYNVWGLLTEGRARKRALHLAQVENGESVLEVAVGTALMFKEIMKRNPDGPLSILRAACAIEACIYLALLAIRSNTLWTLPGD